MLEKPEIITTEWIDALIDLNEDPEVRERVRQREFALHEAASIRAEAVENGRAEECERIIANMRRNGMTEEQIREVIGQNT